MNFKTTEETGPAPAGVRTEYDAAFQAGLQASQPVQIEDGIPFLVVPPEHSVESLAEFLPTPARRKATVQLAEVASFISYVNSFKTDATRLFATEQPYGLGAIPDYHAAGPKGDAAWCAHRASLVLKHSPEWSTWTGWDRKSMGQTAFAEFLEDNAADIAEPDGATVLEAARHLEAKKTVRFVSGVNLSNGAAVLTYDEAIEGKGKGSVTVPVEFTLGLAPFAHGPSYKVRARLRYRIGDDKLSFVYLLERPHKIIEAAFAELITEAEAGVEIEALWGSVAP